MGHATFAISSLNDFDEGGPEAELDLAPRTELLSVFEETFEQRSCLEECASSVELSLAVKLTDIGSLEAVLVDVDGKAVCSEFIHLVVEFFFFGSDLVSEELGVVSTELTQFGVSGSKVVPVEENGNVRKIWKSSGCFPLCLELLESFKALSGSWALMLVCGLHPCNEVDQLLTVVSGSRVIHDPLTLSQNALHGKGNLVSIALKIAVLESHGVHERLAFFILRLRSTMHIRIEYFGTFRNFAARSKDLCAAKVTDDQVAIFIEKPILKVQVSMHDIQLIVEVRNYNEHLLSPFVELRLAHISAIFVVICAPTFQVATILELQHEDTALVFPFQVSPVENLVALYHSWHVSCQLQCLGFIFGGPHKRLVGDGLEEVLLTIWAFTLLPCFGDCAAHAGA